MAFTERSKMFGCVGRIIVATCRHAGRWLAVRSVAGPTIRIDVDVKTVVAWRQAGQKRNDLQPGFGVRINEARQFFCQRRRR